MENKNLVYILGSGTSTGVPTLGCQCKVCTSRNQKNKRLRSSILIKTKKSKNILIDTSTDLRTQLLNNHISDIDAAIITHEHADHTHGIDDLRPFCFYKHHPIPVYTSAECGSLLKEKFPYIFNRHEVFKNKSIIGGGIPKLDLHIIQNFHAYIEDEEFFFFKLKHGYTFSLGFMTNKFAYIVDCQEIPREVLDLLKKQQLELLIIDCLRTNKHQTHLHLDLTLEYSDYIQAKQTGLTHLSHEFDHDLFVQQLLDSGRSNVFPVYDQQILSY